MLRVPPSCSSRRRATPTISDTPTEKRRYSRTMSGSPKDGAIPTLGRATHEVVKSVGGPLVLLVAVLGLASTIGGWAYGRFWPGLAMFCVGLAGAGAGACLGLLFGLIGQSEDGKSTTGLDQVADWLTKILIGFTLAEAGRIIRLSTRVVNWAEANVNSTAVGGNGLMVVLVATGCGAVSISLVFTWMRVRVDLPVAIAGSDSDSARLRETERENDLRKEQQRKEDRTRAGQLEDRLGRAVARDELPNDRFRDDVISRLAEVFAVVPELRPFGFETVVDLSGIGRIRIEVIGQDERPRSVEWRSAHRTWIRQLHLEGRLVIAPTKAHL